MKIPFKSRLSRFKNIANRNKAFEALTSKQQRMEIAYEGLMLVIKKIVSPLSGGYWNDRLLNIRANDSASFQERLLDLPQGCKVCADGLIMLSQIRLSNCIESWDGGRSNGRGTTLKGFTSQNLNEMRLAFDYNYNSTPYTEQTKEKLANICCNVLANGNYKPADRKDYLTPWNIKF